MESPKKGDGPFSQENESHVLQQENNKKTDSVCVDGAVTEISEELVESGSSLKENTELQNAAIQIKSTIQQTLVGLESQTEEKSNLDLVAQDKIAALQQTLLDNASNSNSDIKPLPNFDVDLKVESLLDKTECLIGLVDSSVTSDLKNVSTEALKLPKESGKTKNESNHKKTVATSSPVISSKRKGEKTADQVMKWLAQCGGTTEDKLKLLCKKCVEALDEGKSYEIKLKQSEKQNTTLVKEKEQLQGEQSRLLLIRSRLEGLCRELQRQNKVIKDESLLRLREEEEKRKEIANKFQSTLNDITNLTQENQQRNTKLREENDELAKKLKDLIEHYEAWEKHTEKLNHQKELECQLANAKLAQAQLQLRQEQENHLMVKQELLFKLESLQAHCNQLIKAEFQVRSELAAHFTKFEEYQTEVSNSNKVISNFTSDMEKMIKKVKSLEKETLQWKHRCESGNKALIEMAADKQKRDQEMSNMNQKVATLEKLCRALQIERNTLRSQIKPTTSNPVDLQTPNTPINNIIADNQSAEAATNEVNQPTVAEVSNNQ